MVYVSNKQLTEGLSPIKVEDESEDMIAYTGRSGAGGGGAAYKLNQQRKFTVGYDSRRSNDQSLNPPDRATSNKKGSVSDSRKPPTFAAQGSIRYSMRGAQKGGPMSLDPAPSNDNN